ncbi:MAG TPA: flagellar type III secretion system pore protein FliP [Polyangiaceae bacterium]|nr:flagellar type III secretion system pore protein FliP [Polyangiaceae bacterium]
MNPSELLSGQQLAPSIKILLVLTIMALLPAIVLSTTSFVRTVVVLSFVRQALGAGNTPPNQVLIGLAIFISIFTMQPVAENMNEMGLRPYLRQEVTEMQALERAVVPLKQFMLRQTREKDLQLFYAATETKLPNSPEEVELRIAMPAFLVSELTTAFQMGVMILLPFLVVDVVVASLLMSMGMMMVPPSMLSLPVKLLLFVLVDGWGLVVGSLLRSFA